MTPEQIKSIISLGEGYQIDLTGFPDLTGFQNLLGLKYVFKTC
jgi:hypothetical protein